MRKLMIIIVLLGATAQASRAQPVPCCPLNIGDRVRLVVDNPYNALNLPAGTCGTVLCCDPTWPFADQLFVSWDNWTDGVNDDFSQCSQTPPAYANNSGWWLECGQAVVDTVACPAVVPVCGNGICEPGETTASCPQDCAPDCFILAAGNRVRLLVDNPYGAINLPAGSCGTVLCFDLTWSGLDQLFVSWDGWTDGVNDDSNQCQTPPPPYLSNSGWWVECAQVVVDDMACPPPVPVCGNGLCEPGETLVSCYADCAPIPVCGNGICEPGEDSTNCASDCTGSCCDLLPGDLVMLLVANPFNANSLPAGTCGTVICCDTSWTGPDQTFVSFNNWTLGTNDLGMCSTPPAAYTPNSGWWIACDQVVKGADADGDGVVDCLDLCSSTPAGEVVDANGCGCSQINCDDGNACTTDTCLNGVCSHTLTYDPATQCCNPATGVVTTISDNDACTVDACDAATGTVTHTAIPDCPPIFRLTIMPGGKWEDYPVGTCVDVSAPAAPSGMEFSSWSGDVNDTANPIRVCLNGNMTITANFVTASTPAGSNTCGACGVTGPAAACLTVIGMLVMKAGYPRRKRRD